MSSHHIVRDEQEPALLIDDPSALEIEHVDQLLEWSPKVVVTQNALEEVLHWGIKIDSVIMNLEDIDQWRDRLKTQSPVSVLGFEHADLLASGMVYLLDEKYPAVNILADIYQSRVLDIVKSEARQIQASIFHQNHKWVLVHTSNYEKWVETGHTFGLHPIRENTFLKTTGFFEDKHDEMLDQSIELTAESTGKISIQTNQKPIWLVEQVKTDIYK